MQTQWAALNQLEGSQGSSKRCHVLKHSTAEHERAGPVEGKDGKKAIELVVLRKARGTQRSVLRSRTCYVLVATQARLGQRRRWWDKQLVCSVVQQGANARARL